MDRFLPVRTLIINPRCSQFFGVMRILEKYVEETFPQSILRERQDSKTRYEIGAKGVRIAAIFASIEENKERLQLSDYGVSQTSLEQVFNIYAAEAEKLKQGRNDR
jgi:ATP-binding cassette subfamily A (ABC1) protein 3